MVTKTRRLNIKGFLLIIILLSIASCSKSFDEKIADRIEENCKDQITSKCSVDLNELTEFDWDSLYVFGGLMTVGELNQALGFECNCDHLPDNYYRLVFTKNKSIVYESQYYGLDGKVQFRPVEMNGKIKFSKNQSKFFVTKKSNTPTAEFFYDLYPLERSNDEK